MSLSNTMRAELDALAGKRGPPTELFVQVRAARRRCRRAGRAAAAPPPRAAR
jgi:hypothetical protein